MGIDVVDPVHGDEVMLAIRAVVLSEFNRASFDVINSANLVAARSDDIHMVFDVGVHLSVCQRAAKTSQQ